MDYTRRWKWTRSQQPSILVLDPPTHPEDENFAGKVWPGQHLPGHGCRGPTDAPGHLTQPSGLPCWPSAPSSCSIFGGVYSFFQKRCRLFRHLLNREEGYFTFTKELFLGFFILFYTIINLGMRNIRVIHLWVRVVGACLHPVEVAPQPWQASILWLRIA